MDNDCVEGITSSLIREYLSRKGLRTTLQVMDEEMPRSENSISNRQSLVKALHIEHLMKRNKLLEQPLRCMLEVIIKDILESEITSRQTAPQKAKASPASNANKRRSLGGTPLLLEQENGIEVVGPYAITPPSPTTRTAEPGQTTPLGALPGNSFNHNDVVEVSSSDMVLEDSVEGETVLGSGTAGLIHKDHPEKEIVQKSSKTLHTAQYAEDKETVQKARNRPHSSRNRGLSGPVTSSLEHQGRRKVHKARPLTSVSRSHQKTNHSNSNIHAETDSLRNPPTPNGKLDRISSSSSFDDSKLEDIETLISKPIQPKSKIEDVLDIDSARPKTPASRRQSSIEKDSKHYSVTTSSIGNGPVQSRGGNQARPISSGVKTKVGDIEIGDVDDFDIELAALDLGPRLPVGKTLQNNVDSRPIDVKTAVMLKSLMFGVATKSFNDEWRYQSFTFCDLPSLEYGIVQKKGGPCGVLAAVQAMVLQELLFTENKIPVKRRFDPSHEERSCALAVALGKVLWRAGEQKKAVVAIPSGRPVFTGGGSMYRSDELTETLMLNHFKSSAEVVSFMKQCIGQFELDGYSGVILLVYSAILSRGIDVVKSDMDEEGSKLMGAHHYCTQEIVNLLLTGRAGRSDIGFLSLFEHFKSCQVGTYYKTPKYPIWLVCSESHFSVLFAVKKDLVSDWKAERHFDLYYYDGLARQQEEIKLTVDTTNRFFKPPSEDELIPPLELCIRTKWADAEIDWNGTEPLL
ncbi:hypothetical protein ScPMuIL_016482 [Solemya velum]